MSAGLVIETKSKQGNRKGTCGWSINLIFISVFYIFLRKYSLIGKTLDLHLRNAGSSPAISKF